MIKDAEIAIVNAVTEALQFMDKNPNVDSEEIIKRVMSATEAKSEAKISAIASVNNAIKLKRADNTLTNKQIAQQSVSDYQKFLVENS